MPHTSVEDTLTTVQKMAPHTTFLALGQTVFWDEPVKAVWRRLLDRFWPSAQLLAGIHDTDYFAKTTAHVSDDQQFVALAHDDGATRGLWSAAGELSAFLGSEDLPSRSFFESIGIPFNQLAGHAAETRRMFFSEFTSAYGWRGVVQTSGTAQVSKDVPLQDFGPALLDLIDWGFTESALNLAESTKENCQSVLETIRSWVSSYLESCQPEATLTDLYQHLLPRFYELLLDIQPSNFTVSATSELLRFNPETASLPRFHFVQIFLDPTTRSKAVAAYSKAVAGGGMYGLDSFGDGAIPFDIVVPGLGRGTLHILDDHLLIDFAGSPTTLETNGPVTNALQLAEILNSAYGPKVILVGKAVSLISMLSAEFTLIFHESASGYTDRTAAMNDDLRSAGIALPSLSPIVRLQYNTWDSLAVADAQLQLPGHLQIAFNTGGLPISAQVFSKTWRSAIKAQQDTVTQLSTKRQPRELIKFLQNNGEFDYWAKNIIEFEGAIEELKANYARTTPLRNTIKAAKEQIEHVKTTRARLEEQSGNDYRARLRSLRNRLESGESNLLPEIEAIDHQRQIEFAIPIEALAARKRSLTKTLKNLVRELRAFERTPNIIAARETISALVREANLAKLQAARSAYLTVHGLPHTNSRPSAWWFPLVDPSGKWFDELTETVEARLEYI